MDLLEWNALAGMDIDVPEKIKVSSLAAFALLSWVVGTINYWIWLKKIAPMRVLFEMRTEAEGQAQAGDTASVWATSKAGLAFAEMCRIEEHHEDRRALLDLKTAADAQQLLASYRPVLPVTAALPREDVSEYGSQCVFQARRRTTSHLCRTQSETVPDHALARNASVLDWTAAQELPVLELPGFPPPRGSRSRWR